MPSRAHYSDTEGAGSCSDCIEGTYQNAVGGAATACEVCRRGYYCEAGASAPLPCPGGTHTNATMITLGLPMTSVEQCVICPEGTFCSVGSAAPTPCAPGTFNPHTNATTCSKCAAGEYQDAKRSRRLQASAVGGYYCEAGASAPLPCPGGTHMDLSLPVMTSVEQCVICPRARSARWGRRRRRRARRARSTRTRMRRRAASVPLAPIKATAG